MKKLLVITGTVLLLFHAAAAADVLRNLCHEDHTGPSALTYPENKIGSVAGYGAFAVFVDEGGYGEDQNTLAEIEDLNADFQDDYDTLQAEADGIYEWLNTTFTIGPAGMYGTMAAYESARDAKVQRRNEIDAEVDETWCDLADTIRGMISDSSYEAYLEAHDLAP